MKVFSHVVPAIAAAGLLVGSTMPAAGADLESLPAWKTNDSVLVLAPHPDDETIACGGVIQSALSSHIPVRVAFLTHGDINEWSFLIYRKHPVLMPNAVERMGLVRHDEAIAAAGVLGLASNNLTFLGYPDFGTLHMWISHWGERPPFAALLTRATTVPYPGVLRPGAPYRGQEVVADLRTVIREAKPTRIFVSHRADHNPDHAALFLFTQVALWDLESERRPQLYEYLVHYPGWPERAATNGAAAISPPAGVTNDSAWCSLTLSGEQLKVKRAAIRKHKTQYGYSSHLLESFMRGNEIFAAPGPFVSRAPGGADLTNGASARVTGWAPEELTAEEKAGFVGVEAGSGAIEDGKFVLTIATSRALGGFAEASAYVFGYRSDKPFAEMPKVHVTIGPMGHRTEDQETRLDDSGWMTRRDGRHIVLRIPVQALGNPDRIFFSGRTYYLDIPLDWGGWNVLDLRREERRGAER